MTSRVKAKRPYTPAIVGTGLILIIVPSVLGAVFLLGVNHFWQRFNILAQRSQQLNTVSLLHEQMFCDLMSYGYAVMTDSFEGAHRNKAKALLNRGRVLSALTELKTLDTKYREDLPAGAASLLLSITKMSTDVDEVGKTFQTMRFTSNIDRFASCAAFLGKGLVVSKEFEKVTSEEATIRRKILQSQMSDGDFLNEVIVLGFCVSLVISSLLLLAFGKRILSRFRIVKNNATKLSVIGTEFKPLLGDDEFAYLDRILLNIAEKLAKSNEENRMRMQMVAHDVRSPIMSIQISARLVEECCSELVPAPISVLDACGFICDSSQRVVELLTSFLLLENLETNHVQLELSAFSIRELVDECIVDHIGKIEVSNECAPTIISADRRLMKRAIANFLEHAARSSPAKGMIRVVSIESQKALILRVVDQSLGLASTKARQKLFSKFFLIESKTGDVDVGLGLNLSKLIIERHNGEVGAKSIPGEGSTLWFSIPLINERTTNDLAQEPNRAFAPDDKRSWNVLVRQALSPGLSRQIAILFVVPLVLQFSCVFWFDRELQETRYLGQLDENRSDSVATMTNLCLKVFQASCNTAFFVVIGRPGFKTSAEADISKVESINQTFTMPPNADAVEKALWRETVDYGLNEAVKLRDLLITTSQNRAASDVGLLPSVVSRNEVFNARIQNFLAQQSTKYSELKKRQDALWASVKTSLFIFIAADLIVLLTLLVWFIRQTRRLLNQVIENAERLPRGIPLEPLIREVGEIGELDFLVHSAADDLKFVRSQHQALINLISDEIAKPLQAMFTSAEYVTKECEGLTANPLVLSNSKRIVSNIDRILRMISELLALETPVDGRLELHRATVQLKQVFARSIESTANLADRKDIKFEVRCPEIEAFLDQERMVQVLVNLISNGIKFSPAHTKIFLSAELVEDGFKLTVEDQGCGIDEKVIQSVFDKFFKAENSSDVGFGLGLAICKLIVDSHGGSIGVDSQVGKGSKFWLLLPGSR
jgi:signal transduction histidine kinase